MLKTVSVVVALAMAGCGVAHADHPQFSGINKVSFHQSEYDNDFAGNGFLIEYKGEIYATR